MYARRICIVGRRIDAVPKNVHLPADGFSVLELIVAMGLITVLLALALPAIHNARQSARRLECANNLRNLCVGLLSANADSQSLPTAGVVSGWNGESLEPRANWVTSVLPFCERRDVYDAVDFSKSLIDPVNERITRLHISTLVCPADRTATGGGDLSFVVNGGLGQLEMDWTFRFSMVRDAKSRLIDMDGDGVFKYEISDQERHRRDTGIWKATTLFIRRLAVTQNSERGGPIHTPGSRSFASIVDGMSNTLMITENVRTGFDPYDATSTWASTKAHLIFATVNPLICKEQSCSAGNVDFSKANDGIGGINSGLALAEGEAPWPNSFHPGGVNIGLADGSVRFLSEDTDGRAYFNFFTPDSVRLIGTPLDVLGVP